MCVWAGVSVRVSVRIPVKRPDKLIYIDWKDAYIDDYHGEKLNEQVGSKTVVFQDNVC